MNTDDWKLIATYPAIERPEYNLTLEEYRNDAGQQMMFVSFHVFEGWSSKLLKQMQHEWALLRKHIPGPMFCNAQSFDAKWDRFVQLFGWKYLTEGRRPDGSTHRIYWHQGNGFESPINRHDGT